MWPAPQKGENLSAEKSTFYCSGDSYRKNALSNGASSKFLSWLLLSKIICKNEWKQKIKKNIIMKRKKVKCKNMKMMSKMIIVNIA